MKKLVKELDGFAETFQIKLSKWQRKILFKTITKFITEIRDAKV